MKRRPKGMGSVTNLGKGRRKPYLATLGGVCIGTYRNKVECEKALLSHIMTNKNLFPNYINDLIRDEYIEFIYDMQLNRLLPESVDDFPNMEMINEMFLNKLKLSGRYSDIENNAILTPTFKEIWENEFSTIAPNKSQSWAYNYSAGFNHLSNLHDLRIPSIKMNDVQSAFDIAMSKKSGESKLTFMKLVCSIVYNYAIRNDIVEKDLSKYIKFHSTSDVKNERTPFTKDEIELLFNDNTEISKVILIYIYTGMRPVELIKLKKEDVHIEDRYIIGGVKTKSGKRRIIPIHKDILPFFVEACASGYYFLFSSLSSKYLYNKYLKLYHDTMDRLNMRQHNDPYDTRHTFSTIAKISKMETSARKKIMGHTCNDLTDDVYTHEPIKYLIAEMDKINLLAYC